jgi:hypothetical protein
VCGDRVSVTDRPVVVVRAMIIRQWMISDDNRWSEDVHCRESLSSTVDLPKRVILGLSFLFIIISQGVSFNWLIIEGGVCGDFAYKNHN